MNVASGIIGRRLQPSGWTVSRYRALCIGYGEHLGGKHVFAQHCTVNSYQHRVAKGIVNNTGSMRFLQAPCEGPFQTQPRRGDEEWPVRRTYPQSLSILHTFL